MESAVEVTRSRTTFPGGPGTARKRPDPPTKEAQGASLHKRRFLQNPGPPPRLPLKINPDKSLFMSYVLKENSTSDSQIFSSGTPWTSYRKLMQEDQAGVALIAHENQADFRIVAIKSREMCGNYTKGKIRITSHVNLVNLQGFFEHEGTINFVYESFSVSLADIQASPYGLLREYEIAAVCKELLEGLSYITKTLKVGHVIRCETILMAGNGYPKIANIGDTMSKSPELECIESCRSLGHLLKNLLEPASVLDAATGLSLSSPHPWSNDAESFLHQTSNMSLDDLKTHDFLQRSPGPHCLIPHVLIAQRTMRKTWALLPDMDH
ncbi:hypothetical protein BDV97DRAFT_174983 [Delphinella strobiligena]|nr:hypothetical protein BDV97DRAFT_174983 [Delphinella strobiligena]